MIPKVRWPATIRCTKGNNVSTDLKRDLTMLGLQYMVVHLVRLLAKIRGYRPGQPLFCQISVPIIQRFVSHWPRSFALKNVISYSRNMRFISWYASSLEPLHAHSFINLIGIALLKPLVSSQCSSHDGRARIPLSSTTVHRLVRLLLLLLRPVGSEY